MFNLKRKAESVLKTISDSQKNPQTISDSQKNPQLIIAEIHNDFDTATEKLLTEAKQIVAKDTSRGERLAAIGFTSCKEVTEDSIKKYTSKILESALHFQLHYPNNKFITKEQAKEICLKHGL